MYYPNHFIKFMQYYILPTVHQFYGHMNMIIHNIITFFSFIFFLTFKLFKYNYISIYLFMIMLIIFLKIKMRINRFIFQLLLLYHNIYHDKKLFLVSLMVLLLLFSLIFFHQFLNIHI